MGDGIDSRSMGGGRDDSRGGRRGEGESKSVGGARRVWEGPGVSPACVAQAAGRIAFLVSRAVRTACEEQQERREPSPAQSKAGERGQSQSGL